MSAPVQVTDHAVLRFLERVGGLDLSETPVLCGGSDSAILWHLERITDLNVAALRSRIAAGCARGARAGAPVIRFAGARFLLRGNTVVTVLAQADIPGHAMMADLIHHPERGKP